MRSIPYAMTWELLQRGRWPMMLGLLGANLLPLLILTALRMDGPLDPSEPAFLTIQVVMLQITTFAFGTALLAAQTESMNRLFTLPITTSTLVTWRLIPAMVVMALGVVFCSSLVNVLFDLDWPLWAPAIFAAVTVAAIQGALSYSEKTPWVPFYVSAAAAVMGLWYKSRCGPVFSAPTHLWRDVTLIDAAAMTVITIASYYISMIGIARQRCGDQASRFNFLNAPLGPSNRGPIDFVTPLQAQFWSESRTKGIVYPVTVVTGLVIGLAIWLLFIRQAKDLVEGMLAGGACLSVAGMVAGLVLGNCGPNEATMEMGQFLGTRPMTDVDLARTTLKVALRGVLISWAIWLGFVLSVLAILYVSGTTAAAPILSHLYWWYWPATLIGSWIVVSIVACMAMAGRAQLIAKVIAVVIIAAIGSILFSKLLEREQQLWLRSAGLIVVGMAISGVSLWMMDAARRRSLVTSGVVVLFFSMWIILGGITVFETIRMTSTDYPFAVFLTGIASLVVLPYGAAPLAMSWNRHR